ncbi:hypothetical protein U9M48_030199 [Paspalum notatum var. saurae]|uniref:Myb/SANT-like domain-containing protein n=1 Tax=Paspalum notatum var. saurae TaxID=547442 RepID=A0AAQ3X1V6_PASNO
MTMHMLITGVHNPSRIQEFDWAAYIHKRLIMGAAKYKADVETGSRSPILTGCCLFLQVFYLDNMEMNEWVLDHQVRPRVSDFTYERLKGMIADTHKRLGPKSSSIYGKSKVRWARSSMETPMDSYLDTAAMLWEAVVNMITIIGVPLEDHQKDAKFLNVPIQNYQFMQTVFGAGVATGRFAMGSNEPLGNPPTKQETIDVDKAEAPPTVKDKIEQGKGKCKQEANKKRKRVINEDDAALMTGFTDAIWGLNAALSEGNHAEAAPGIYRAVMGCTNFSKDDLMTCLNYLMEHKAPTMVFLEMSVEDKELWISTYLTKVRTKMTFQ